MHETIHTSLYHYNQQILLECDDHLSMYLSSIDDLVHLIKEYAMELPILTYNVKVDFELHTMIPVCHIQRNQIPFKYVTQYATENFNGDSNPGFATAYINPFIFIVPSQPMVRSTFGSITTHRRVEHPLDTIRNDNIIQQINTSLHQSLSRLHLRDIDDHNSCVVVPLGRNPNCNDQLILGPAQYKLYRPLLAIACNLTDINDKCIYGQHLPSTAHRHLIDSNSFQTVNELLNFIST